jgi:hypothetical protein
LSLAPVPSVLMVWPTAQTLSGATSVIAVSWKGPLTVAVGAARQDTPSKCRLTTLPTTVVPTTCDSWASAQISVGDLADSEVTLVVAPAGPRLGRVTGLHAEPVQCSMAPWPLPTPAA